RGVGGALVVIAGGVVTYSVPATRVSSRMSGWSRSIAASRHLSLNSASSAPSMRRGRAPPPPTPASPAGGPPPLVVEQRQQRAVDAAGQPLAAADPGQPGGAFGVGAAGRGVAEVL